MNKKALYAAEKKTAGYLYAELVVAVVLCCISLLYTSRFWINDDTLMCSLVSGAYNGEYNSEIVFIWQPLGWIWSWLYSLNDEIPWYGLTHLACVAGSLYALLIILLKRAKGIKQIAICTLVFILYVVSVFTYTITFPQFTTTAAFMAAGMVALALNINLKRPASKQVGNYFLLAFFGFVTCVMRKNIYMMILPVVLLILLVKLLFAGFRKKIVLTAVIVGLGSVFLYYGLTWYNSVAQSAGMQSFKEYNAVRSQIADYKRIEDYEKAEDFYEELDMGEPEYQLLKEGYYNIIDDSLSQDRVQQVVDHATEQKAGINLSNSILLKTVYFSSELWNRTCVVILLFLISVIFLVINKYYEGLLIVMGTFFGMLFESFILAITGRFVDRIAISMLVVNVYVILLCVSMYMGKFKWPRFTCILGIAGAISCLITLPMMNSSIQSRGKLLADTTEIREDLYDYAKENPEYFYYYDAIDSNSLISSTALTYEKAPEFWNIERAGGWLEGSPAYQKKIENYGFDSFLDGAEKGIVRLISWEFPTKIYEYLKDMHPSCYLQEADTTDSGYTVYEIKF